MNKELKEKLKKSLNKEKLSLEKELASFAKKDESMENNWDTKRLKAEYTDMEEKADEVEEYDNLLSLEHSLELKLKDVNWALEKMEKSEYGTCEKCGKEIEEKRLRVCSEAKLCIKCNENK